MSLSPGYLVAIQPTIGVAGNDVEQQLVGTMTVVELLAQVPRRWPFRSGRFKAEGPAAGGPFSYPVVLTSRWRLNRRLRDGSGPAVRRNKAIDI
jgi:hypothetical protein